MNHKITSLNNKQGITIKRYITLTTVTNLILGKTPITATSHVTLIASTFPGSVWLYNGYCADNHFKQEIESKVWQNQYKEWKSSSRFTRGPEPQEPLYNSNNDKL